MKIKELYVEAKRSKNFQTQLVGIEMSIDDSDENKDNIVKTLQLKVNELAMEALQTLL